MKTTKRNKPRNNNHQPEETPREKYVRNFSTLKEETEQLLERWKQFAIEKMSGDAPCSWTHGLEVAQSVDTFEDAFVGILDTLDRHTQEHREFAEAYAAEQAEQQHE